MSSILQATKDLKKTVFWLKFGTIVCMPCCCIGLTCMFIGTDNDDFLQKYKQIIELYGKINLVLINKKIKQELIIFRNAVSIINKTIDPKLIKQNIRLDNIIFDMNPRIKATLSSAIDNLFDNVDIFLDGDKKKYSEQIWNKYIELGGSYYVVIYGYIEYMCMMNDPTCNTVKYILDKMVTDSTLRAECLSYKERAGF